LSNKNSLNSTSHFVDFLWLIREWEYKNFPAGQGRILFDILVLVNVYESANKKLPVKALQFSLPYSARGISYATEKLISDGWCELTVSQADRRLKYISGTEKLAHIFHAYEVFFYSALEKSHQNMNSKPLVSEEELKALLCLNEDLKTDLMEN